ncbi:hypothetical protein C0992_000348 [Termitomyces sp. T32_za158]|nr:hypothetical protein C0992_000348 [Termitomyces sp. T32_za158]
MTSEEYDSISASQIISKLAQRNLVIIDDHAVERDFNEDTLSLLGSLEASVNIHDLSLDLSGPDRVKRGSPLDLLRTLDEQNPKALSGLNFPLCYDPFPLQKFSSDSYAWTEAQGKSFCKSSMPYPVPEMRWGLGSTALTYHYFHIDAKGYGIFIDIDHGFWPLPNRATTTTSLA